ncbi:hypothetical protein [Candidatus Borrarchaeum sp.]|uniref:hypothetical protein n=1 Tax=Candidatus Borrarchaeum sp. TaxID=2846742 RepID=UPI00257F34C8|nr:hypothetical protein [Candidatus Borrarchaeum sp.]
MIDELIIMNQQGTILFYTNYTDEKCDNNFISNLILAIQQFAEIVLSSNLEAIRLKDSKYIFLKDDDLSVAIRTNEQQVTEKMQELIYLIRNRFLEKFGLLKNFSGDVSIFNTFENELLEILPNEKPKITSQELLTELFGIKINSKKILNEL